MAKNDNKLNMGNRKLKLGIALLFSIGLSGMQAQILLNVKYDVDVNTSFSIGDIRKLTFSDGNMNIQKLDKSSRAFGIADVVKLYFSDISTSIQSPIAQLKNKTILYPNPVKDQLFIKQESVTNCNTIVELIDLQGKILRKQLMNTQTSINISELQKGIYLCRLQSCSSIEIIKFVKK